MEELQRGSILYCPKGRSGSGMMALDLTKVEEAEARLDDVRRVNPASAPYLLALFNRAFLDLQRMLAALHAEYLFATRNANKRKAIVNLDVAPRILMEKGLATAKNPSGSADLRQAVLDGDEEWNKLQDRVDLIKAVHALLQGRCKSVEMAYTATKRILDKGNGTSLGHVPMSVGDVDDALEAGCEVDSDTGKVTLVGKARY